MIVCKVQSIPKNVDPEEGLTAQLHYHYQQLLVQGQWSPVIQNKTLWITFRTV